MTSKNPKPLTTGETWMAAQVDTLMLLGDLFFHLRCQRISNACYQKAAAANRDRWAWRAKSLGE